MKSENKNNMFRLKPLFATLSIAMLLAACGGKEGQQPPGAPGGPGGAPQAVEVDVAGNLELQGDATRLKQVFVNLIANAGKFAPEVLGRADARERILDRLVGYSVALVDHERARRNRAAPASSPEAGASGRGLPEARTAPSRAATGPGRIRRPEVKR